MNNIDWDIWFLNFYGCFMLINSELCQKVLSLFYREESPTQVLCDFTYYVSS